MTLSALLQAQVDAWNRGDVDGFCASCAEDVVYVGAAGVRAGRDAVRDGYRRAYPDAAAMGTLALEIERVEERGDTAVAVVRWSVRAGATSGGHALLVFRKQGDLWQLAYDATIA